MTSSQPRYLFTVDLHSPYVDCAWNVLHYLCVSSLQSQLGLLLKEAFGGNSVCTLILTASPSSFSRSQTRATLQFGHKCRKLHNRSISCTLPPAFLAGVVSDRFSRLPAMRFTTIDTLLSFSTPELQRWRFQLLVRCRRPHPSFPM